MREDRDIGSRELGEHLLIVAAKFHKINLSKLVTDLSHREMGTLEMIGRHMAHCPEEKGIFVNDLAKCQGTFCSSVSRTLRSLEEKGLIGRRSDTNDRRNTYVFLTKEGQKKREETAIITNRFTTAVMERMGQDKIKILLGLWYELEGIMQEEVENIYSQNLKNGRIEE